MTSAVSAIDGVRAQLAKGTRGQPRECGHATRFFTGFSQLSAYHLLNAKGEAGSMDVIYILLLIGLYLITHGLVWAVSRLAEER